MAFETEKLAVMVLVVLFLSDLHLQLLLLDLIEAEFGSWLAKHGLLQEDKSFIFVLKFVCEVDCDVLAYLSLDFMDRFQKFFDGCSNPEISHEFIHFQLALPLQKLFIGLFPYFFVH